MLKFAFYVNNGRTEQKELNAQFAMIFTMLNALANKTLKRIGSAKAAKATKRNISVLKLVLKTFT